VRQCSSDAYGTTIKALAPLATLYPGVTWGTLCDKGVASENLVGDTLLPLQIGGAKKCLGGVRHHATGGLRKNAAASWIRTDN
jgi:hypothetical protein